jgi:hypothetical protein
MCATVERDRPQGADAMGRRGIMNLQPTVQVAQSFHSLRFTGSAIRRQNGLPIPSVRVSGVLRSRTAGTSHVSVHPEFLLIMIAVQCGTRGREHLPSLIKFSVSSKPHSFRALARHCSLVICHSNACSFRGYVHTVRDMYIATCSINGCLLIIMQVDV